MRKIAWVLSNDGISGGVSVVLYHATNLARMGFDVSIVVARQPDGAAFSWHPRFGEKDRKHVRVLSFSEASAERFDVAIATFWTTALMLWRLNAGSYLYFVQSVESRFYDESDIVTRYLVDATYELGLGMITVATWMQKYLEKATGARVQVARNGIDKTVFCSPARPRANGKLRLLIEGATDSRFKNVPNTVDLCHGAEVGEVWLLTPTAITDYSKVDRVFSAVPMTEVPRIYGECDILVKLSLVEGMFGPPLEMFHCGGTAIVYDVTGHDEYIQDGLNAVVVGTGDEAKVVRAIRALASSRDTLADLKRGAAATAQTWPSTEESTNQFVDSLEGAASEARCDRQQLAVLSRRLWSLYVAARQGRKPSSKVATAREVRAVQRALAEVLQSTSWRITRPLRAGVAVARKIRNALPRLRKTRTKGKRQNQSAEILKKLGEMDRQRDKRLKDLEIETELLHRVVSDLTVEKYALQEGAKGCASAPSRQSLRGEG